MARDPRATVEASLEVARRSTTGAGEREAAIAAAKRLIERHGLDADTFDIPGRPRPAPRTGEDLFTSRSTREDVFRSFEEALRRAATRGARYSSSTEAFRDAMNAQADSIRREQERRAAAARGGDPNRNGAAMDMLRADLGINFLWTNGVRVYGSTIAADGSRRWIIPDDSALEYDDVGIVEVAKRRGWGREEEVAGRHPFAVQAAQFLRGRGASVTLNPDGDWTVHGDGISWFDKTSHSVLMAFARQRGWKARGTAG